MSKSSSKPTGKLDLSSLTSISSLLQAAPPADHAGLREIPIEQIQADPNQPRKFYDPEKLAELADSIRAHGIIQPLVLRTSGDGFVIVAGERRWRASKSIPLATVPAIIRDDLSARVQMVENLQREDLTPFEIFRVIAAELDGGATQKELADAYGKSKSWVSEYASVSKMPLALQEALSDGRAGDIYALAELNRLYKRAPAAVDELVNSGATITRHAVNQLSQALARAAAAEEQASASSANNETNGASTSDVSSGAAQSAGNSQGVPGSPTERGNEPPSPARSAPKPGGPHAKSSLAGELPVVIEVQYEGTTYWVRYDDQPGEGERGTVKLVSADGGSVYAPLSALVISAIRVRRPS